nr:hypothetical protein [Tanacetum cinerariifolium]
DDDDARDDDEEKDEGDDEEDDQEEGGDDETASNDEAFIHPSLSTYAEEEIRDDESFDPILKTPKNNDDEGNGEENLSINAQVDNDEFLKTIDENMQKIIKEQVKGQVKVQVSKILPKIEQTMNEQLEAEVLTRLSKSSKTSYAVAADLSVMELKKILIEKIEGNKSIHRSNEHRNLYKALVEAYESDKIILNTYRDTVTLKRRRDDDVVKDEEPSTGSNRGSKRHRKGKEPELASTPKEKVTRSAGRSTQGSKSQKTSTSESATAEEPMQTTFEIEEPSHLEFNTGADDQPIIESSQHPEWFSQQKKPPTPDHDWNKTLLATHESIQPLVKLEILLEEVCKATTDQLDWVNPEGQQYPHNLLKPLPLILNNRGRRVIPFDHFINNDLQYLHGGASSHKYTTSVTKTKAADYRHIKDDDKLYKFKEGDFKRLRIQDIADMLLLLVQGKLTNLTVEERFAFNVSLRMFTRSIVIQRQQVDAKFSDGTLTDVCTALDDRLKGIQMKYLPQSIWRKSDKDRATAMIQAIDKRLKTRRIMRSLKRFVGGRLYEGDFRMLQRTI